jgi:peptidoglycan hydrolase-like protein with peptidoglycan-binding domain
MFEEYEDDAGYSGHAMGGVFDTLDQFGRAINPFDSQFGNFGGQPDPNDPNQPQPVGGPGGFSAADATQIVQPGTVFPSWAGSPQAFAGRVTKLNAVMGTNFVPNTLPTDPQLMAVVAQFQQSAGLKADGEMGPKTEAGLDARLGNAHPVTPPSQPLAVAPSQPAAPQGVNPASATDASGDKTKLFVALGVGGALLLGLGYFALKD